MKKLIYLILLGIFITSCSDSKQNSNYSNSEKKIEPLKPSQVIPLEEPIKSPEETTKKSSSQKKSPDKKAGKWYEGGTLHRAKIREWKNATEENKLATCADFIAKVGNSVTMELLLKRAIELKACINESTKGLESTDNENVTDIAALCTVTLGYN